VEEGVASILDATNGAGCEATIDCSGAAEGRRTALLATRRRGRCALVGEGGELRIAVSPELIHRQITVHGSWVTSIGRMTELVHLLVRGNLHPDVTVTDRFALDEAHAAYALADRAESGKVAIVMGD
jgi:threonine dehydrogenase-like Zn-dependent dehydrogenase